MLEVHSMLALFVLLALSSGIFFAARRFHIPYTVLLVLVGILIVPIVQIPVLNNVVGFLGELKLTPELLFFIFLPALIFESAFNMNVRRMVDSAWSISLLAIIGLLISTFGIAALLYFVLPLVGITIPFIIALLFGAIISSTDPVAVLSLFKEIGVPKRLAMIFEGESLFNDGTAVALFLVILAIIEQGAVTSGTLIEGVGMFAGMVVFGLIFGLAVAALFSAVLKRTKSNDFVTATILLVSAHITFISCELINETGLFGLHIHISSIIATTFTALFLGNYSRQLLSTRADNYLGKVTEHIAFMANSLVFLLAGLLFASADVDFVSLLVPILATVAIVAVMRIVAVYAVVLPVNWFKIEAPIPPSWALLLSWGSLRGALAIIIVLLIPADMTVPGWVLPYSPQEFLLALTIGCILATLFIKAPLIAPIIRKLKIDEPEPLTEAFEADLGLYYLFAGKKRFNQHKTKGFVREVEYAKLDDAIKAKIEQAYEYRDMLVKKHGQRIFEQSLHLMAIQVEELVLKQLYMNEEISEKVFRKIKGKLTLQKEKIEYAQHDDIDPSKYTDRKDVFDRLVAFIQSPLGKRNLRQISLEEQLQYYRAQMIIARKVTKELNAMQTEHVKPVFIEPVYDKVYARYATYRRQCSDKVDGLLAKHDTELAPYLAMLAARALHTSGVRALGYLHARGIVDEEVEHAIESRFSVTNL